MPCTAATVLAQGHVLPLPLAAQPVYWEWDHALRLSPAPDALIIGEDQGYWAHDPDGALVFNPGSFGADEAFAVYRPALCSVESCEVNPREDED